jgi:hypothetical protein
MEQYVQSPRGGGCEYLHRDPASRRRRRKGKSQIWESKRWSRVPRNSDPRKSTLARTSSIYKIQTRPLVREGAPQNQGRKCQRVTNIWSWVADGARHQDLLIDWPSVAMWLWGCLLYPCGGGFEYLHRDPASRRGRRKGKSQIWDSKIWSRVPRDSDPRKTAPSSRQRAPHKNKTVTVKQYKYLVMSPRRGSIPRLTDWLTVSRNVTLTLNAFSCE